MPNQNSSDFLFNDDDYRTEDKSQKDSPTTSSYSSLQPYDPGESESPELSMTEDESSPMYQTNQSYAAPVQQTPIPSKKQHHGYMQYEVTEAEIIEINKTLFAAHPMHQCPTLCEYIKDCMLHCQRTMHILMCRPNAYQRSRQIAILQDCAEVCHLTTCQVARRSPILKTSLRYCAKVCRICAEESMRYPDAESQASARICLHCATVCEKFVMHQNWT